MENHKVYHKKIENADNTAYQTKGIYDKNKQTSPQISQCRSNNPLKQQQHCLRICTLYVDPYLSSCGYFVKQLHSTKSNCPKMHHMTIFINVWSMTCRTILIILKELQTGTNRLEWIQNTQNIAY